MLYLIIGWLYEEAKAKYAKYIDANGRLIVDESLPDDVKQAFNYFNSKGINIMELSVDDDIIDLPEEVNDLDSDEVDDVETETLDDSFEDSEEDIDLDSLNNLF